MRPRYAHSLPLWMDSLEQTPVSEGFEDPPGQDARSLVIKSIFKLLIKKKEIFRGTRVHGSTGTVAALELLVVDLRTQS